MIQFWYNTPNGMFIDNLSDCEDKEVIKKVKIQCGGESGMTIISNLILRHNSRPNPEYIANLYLEQSSSWTVYGPFNRLRSV